MVEKQDFEALIVRYLEGMANPEEAMQLEDWKIKSSENQKLYDHYEQLFSEHKFQEVDTDAAWHKVKGEVSSKTKVIPLKDWRYWAVAAAAILVVALILPTLMDNGSAIKPPVVEPLADDQEESNTLYAKNGVQNFMLVDSSTVELTDGSSLELSDNFKDGERRAILNGSGRFTVVHDEAHPFIINVEGLEVHDIGTVFDITTNKDTVKVVVLEGAVELRKNGQVLAMEEGDSAFYLISQRLIKEYPTPESLSGVTKEFNDVPLQEIVNHLADFFNREMVIMDEELKQEGFIISFDDAELPLVISILKEHGLRVEQNNGIIEIYEGI